ncbi:exodeoxyribonuclease V subunit beta [Dyella sp. A6]|uniref:exodeoxyribonuclease V subunit beta n=1 Tax=Dyella aluminiiresistens TaxID=3069105 RepID=UPI002E77F72C|nr:exodeoxyribonuclease V subunit beta [Dyella sp. A6]
MNATAPLHPLRLPLTGTQLIEASAGTGKTWTIAALYLRLVLGHGQDTPKLPAQILVMTFTKAATAELRERIRARLTEAAAVFRSDQSGDDFLRGLLADYPDAGSRAHAARQLELAAQWMDEAAIFTIHGWCQRMLVQHAFDSGEATASGGIADEAELLDEAVRDYWRRFFFLLQGGAVALVARLWKTPQDLLHDVMPLLSRPAGSLRLGGRPLPTITDPAALLSAQATSLLEAEARAREAWRADIDAIEAALQGAVDTRIFHGNKVRAADLPGRLASLRDWAHGASIDDDTLERFTQHRLDASVNANRTAPTHAAFAAIGQLLAVRDEAGSLAPPLLAHAAPWIDARLDDARRQRAQLGYDDMLKRLDTALHGRNGDTFAHTLARQYPVALVDEFQDTDPLQWRILHRLYVRHADTALLLIGDPKQAIYGFRGADIHTYLHARLSAARPTWTLDTNYRSTDALVKAVNRVFEHADTHPEGAFGFGKALPFSGVRAHDRDDHLLLDGVPLTAMQMAVLPSDAPLGMPAYREQSAAHAAARIVHWLDKAQAGKCGFSGKDGRFTPLKPGDIAILVRDRHDADTMRKALRERGLAHVYLSDNQSVFASAEAADLLRWLHACANPASDRAMRTALATPSMGWSLAELDRLNLDEPHWEHCNEQFRQLHELWLRQGVLAMLHELMHRFDLPARLLARRGGERALTNLLHLAELLQQAATGLDGEQALIRHLATHIARPGHGKAAEEQVVRLESEADLIKVVTIHKSKGLEYPVVLLPFVCGYRETKRDSGLLWHDREGMAHFDLSPDPAAWLQAERERLQEDLRLLYVALTRARHLCWLGIACLKDGAKKDSGLHKSAFGYVLGGAQSIAPDDLLPKVLALCDGQPFMAVETLDEPASTQRHVPSADTLPMHAARPCTLPSRTPWWIASYSALAHTDTPTEPAAPETAGQATLAESSIEIDASPGIAITATPQGMHAFPRGAAPGTFLHDLLEACADEGFARAAEPSAAIRDAIARRCQKRGWQAWIKPLTDWLPALLRTPLACLGAPPVALAGLTDSCRYRAELEFWFEAHHVDTHALDRLVTRYTLGGVHRPPLSATLVNGLLKGFIDLVFEHDGRWYVADYKSNWLGPDATAYTADAMRTSVLQARYDLQYAIYSLALHRQLRARLPDYDYDRHMGGVLYLFLRGVDADGHGVHHERLPRRLIEALDALFAGHGEQHDA